MEIDPEYTYLLTPLRPGDGVLYLHVYTRPVRKEDYLIEFSNRYIRGVPEIRCVFFFFQSYAFCLRKFGETVEILGSCFPYFGATRDLVDIEDQPGVFHHAEDLLDYSGRFGEFDLNRFRPVTISQAPEDS